METLATFVKLPMPPTHNQCYRNVPRVGRVSSSKLLQFKKDMHAWYMQNVLTVKSASIACLAALEEGFLYHVDAFFMFQYKSLYAKDGNPKAMDVSNRIKAIHDSVSDLINIDDRFFWSITAQKIELENNELESATIIIKKFKPKTFNDII